MTEFKDATDDSRIDKKFKQDLEDPSFTYVKSVSRIEHYNPAEKKRKVFRPCRKSALEP